MKYMSDCKNQAWSLKLEKSSVRTIILYPLLGDHLFHHLNDNHHPSTQWTNDSATCIYMSLSTNSQGLLYIGIINSFELLSSSARVTSAKFQKRL